MPTAPKILAFAGSARSAANQFSRPLIACLFAREPGRTRAAERGAWLAARRYDRPSAVR